VLVFITVTIAITHLEYKEVRGSTATQQHSEEIVKGWLIAFEIFQTFQQKALAVTPLCTPYRQQRSINICQNCKNRKGSMSFYQQSVRWKPLDFGHWKVRSCV
jgi:hypothetical protein